MTSLAPSCGCKGHFPLCTENRLFPRYLLPIKADKNKEKTMTMINLALLINGIAHLAAAFAKFVTTVRHRR
jgi:hypothetical protein